MSNPIPQPDASRPPRWPWALLGLAMLWVALVRVPLVLNAENHLDSDLAVDGLTLRDALRGDWRLHYPGTPHIGTPALLLSMPQASVWGANPWTLVSGGVVAYELVVMATFLLAWRAFGPRAASWALVPLAFASVGTVWLSGRITGGHLLAAFWHAAAFLGLVWTLRRGGLVRSLLLGLWCGFGLYSDQMTLYSLAGLIPTLILGDFGASRPVQGLVAMAAFLLGGAMGYAPHVLAVRADGYDAYRVSFATILGDEQKGIDWEETADLAGQHARLLALECLPRLVGGHRLPGFQSEPSPDSLRGRPRRRDPADLAPIPVAASLLGLLAALAAVAALVFARDPRGDSAALLVRGGLIVSSIAVVGGFILNRNIYNSDNYRYLALLLVPFACGFGLLLESIARRGLGGLALAGGLAVALAGSMTLDTARWYHGFGWIDDRGVPVRRPLDDPLLAWLRAHPEAERIYGGYWNVYRLAFLAGGTVRGTPYPNYPDRFPDFSDGLPGHRPRLLVVSSDPIDPFNRTLALREGGKILAEGRGFAVIDWPRGDE